MPVKRKRPFDNGHFFITFTCYNWLQLFAITDGYDLVYNWFDTLKKRKKRHPEESLQDFVKWYNEGRIHHALAYETPEEIYGQNL